MVDSILSIPQLAHGFGPRRMNAEQATKIDYLKTVGGTETIPLSRLEAAGHRSIISNSESGWTDGRTVIRGHGAALEKCREPGRHLTLE